jgi:signal transduction histidine kinase
MTPSDLAELMSAFTEVTGKLQQTHESLQREVIRLQGELRQANEQLQRSKRLAALGEMAAGIAHEVRNPLGSIGLYARMLEQDLVDRPAERETAGKIASAVRGLDAIVGDVLSFARELRVSRERLSAADLLAHAAEVCLADHEGAGGAGVRVELPREDVELWADGVQVQQALLNLVRNALQAMEDSPENPRVLRLDAWRDGDLGGEVVLAVSDTGPGVGEDVIDRMFNPFFTTRRTGTGLGLAIVHRIADAHGGRVRVYNNGKGDERDARPTTVRMGATFELVFPGRTDAASECLVEVKRPRAVDQSDASPCHARAHGGES